MKSSPRRPALYRLVTVAVLATLALSACGGDSDGDGPPGPPATTPVTTTKGAPTAAQLAEARRLVDPDHEPTSPTPAQVACVARVVVLNPPIDEVANDMAQIQNPDLRQLVLTDYLNCAYNFVLDLYMRFAPAGLSKPEKACIRSKFTELSVARLSEVMVLDPDAGYTGPLVIHACQTGAKKNPLLYGTIPSMGGS